MSEVNSKDRTNLIVGIILLVLGFGFLFDQLDIFAFNRIWSYIFSWRTVLVVLGFVFAINRKNRALGIIMMAAGVLFWFLQYSGFYISLGEVLLPLIFIFVGLGLLLRRKDTHEFDFANNVDAVNDSISSDYVREECAFGNRIHKVISNNFKGGDVEAVFGKCDLDLRNATLSNDVVCIDCTAVFGNINIIIPEDWTIKSSVSNVFGAYSDKRITVNNLDPQKVLFLKGEAIFGSIELRSF
jgi:Predicted membrane protein (DUF2154).